ncbi:hypothetical protein KGQ27_00365 [Patescibacteria group bacterium]|nr:hypothetical protein [Patescibacteria group bacterium]MDE1946670.1 hypothetical protein [Patescibacteria group bacterium]MDE2010623.1 hypothetical protein [Patescibacteria group bacterium]MDE2232930.1 hypothetical protein [Patescibacteria group bacterium]
MNTIETEKGIRDLDLMLGPIPDSTCVHPAPMKDPEEHEFVLERYVVDRDGTMKVSVGQGNH